MYILSVYLRCNFARTKIRIKEIVESGDPSCQTVEVRQLINHVRSAIAKLRLRHRKDILAEYWLCVLCILQLLVVPKMYHFHVAGRIARLVRRSVEEGRSQQTRVYQVPTNSLLVLQLGGACWRLGADAAVGQQVLVRPERPALAQAPELLGPLVLVLSDERFGPARLGYLAKLFLLLLLMRLFQFLQLLLQDQNTFVVVLKNGVETALCWVLANVAAPDQANRLSLVLFELQHRLSPLLVVINEDLEVDQIIRLDNAVLEFDQDLLLVLLELRELDQVLRLDARVLDYLTRLNLFGQLSQVEFVISCVLQQSIEPILRGQDKVKLRLLLD